MNSSRAPHTLLRPVSRLARGGLTSLLILLCPASAAAADGPDEHYLAGVKAFQDAAYDKAAAEMRASLAEHPSAKAALYLGNAYLKLGRLAQAKDALRLVLKLEPHGPKREAINTLIQSIDARSNGKLVVTSFPAGATIYLDSEATPDHGKSPQEIPIPPGSHTVIAVLEGFETQTLPVESKGGEAVKVDFTLRAKGCDLSLTAEPAASVGSLDGAAAVPLPGKLRVPVGDHKVAITAEGFESKDLAVRCDGIHPIELQATLRADGRLKVPTDPGTTVTVDGKVVTVSAADAAAGIGLPPGRHEVTIAVPNRAPWTTIVEIKAGAEVPVAAPPPAGESGPPAPVGPVIGFVSPSVYVGIEGGGNLVLRDWNLGANAFLARNGVTGIYPGSSGTAGARIGVQVIPRLAIEGEIHWVGLPNALDTSQGLSYGLNAPFHILTGNWTPIVEVGFGAYQVISGKLGVATDVRGHLGIGLRGKLTEWLWVRAEARDVVTQGFGGPGDNVELLVGLEAFVWQKR